MVDNSSGYPHMGHRRIPRPSPSGDERSEFIHPIRRNDVIRHSWGRASAVVSAEWKYRTTAVAASLALLFIGSVETIRTITG